MKIKEKIASWLSKIVIEAVKKSPIEERVAQEIEKLRYDYLPHGACWFCSMPVSRKGGYRMWKGKMFCTEQCLRKYADLIQDPKENYRIIQGEPIEVFAATPSTQELDNIKSNK